MSEAENVIWLEGAEAATHGVPVSKVCDAAKEACEEVVILGYAKDGSLYTRASFAEFSSERTIWLLEQCKAWLLAGCPEQDA